MAVVHRCLQMKVAAECPGSPASLVPTGAGGVVDVDSPIVSQCRRQRFRGVLVPGVDVKGMTWTPRPSELHTYVPELIWVE